jgi:hypothetical protein
LGEFAITALDHRSLISVVAFVKILRRSAS